MSETGYVYRSVEPGLWTVGFYDPSGKWHPGKATMPASFGEALNSGDGSYHP